MTKIREVDENVDESSSSTGKKSSRCSDNSEQRAAFVKLEDINIDDGSNVKPKKKQSGTFQSPSKKKLSQMINASKNANLRSSL